MMFPLTPVTITLSLVGHLIFGLIMGLGFVKTRSAHRFWPWTPVVDWFERDDAEAPAEGTVRVRHPGPTAGAVPSAPRPATPSRPLPVAQERPHVVPPPPLPVGHPSAPIPRQHPSGPIPVAGPSTGSHRTAGSHTGSHPTTGAQPTTGSHPRTGSGPIPVGAARSTGSSGSAARTGSTRTTPPPSGTGDTGNHTLDPETWALWQRQLATTVKGRRTHRWR
jgi:hypothetical protein